MDGDVVRSLIARSWPSSWQDTHFDRVSGAMVRIFQRYKFVGNLQAKS